jgi:hypothetical protein
MTPNYHKYLMGYTVFNQGFWNFLDLETTSFQILKKCLPKSTFLRNTKEVKNSTITESICFCAKLIPVRNC